MTMATKSKINDKLMDRVMSALAVGTPIIAIRTPDQPAVVARLTRSFNGYRALVVHDVTRGLTALNASGKEAVAEIVGDSSPVAFGDPVQAIQGAQNKMPEKGVLIMVAGDRSLGDNDGEPVPAIAAMIARDDLSTKGCALIVLCSSYQPARELGSDALVLDDNPPDEDARRVICSKLCEDAEVQLSDADRTIAIQYTRGLSAFAAQQTIALSITKKGLNATVLRDVWRKAIDAIQGLRVQEDPQDASLDRIAGLANLKDHAREIVSGKTRPNAIVWIDEAEKVFAGATGGDLSGSSQAVLGAILTEMEESKAEGMLAVGPGGVGKSLAATTIGAAGGIPTIALNPGQIKGSLVGQTEANVARAMSTLRAIGGRCYWIATSNNLASIPPELQRRFTDGIWMFDLPDPSERAAMWAMYMKQYELSGQEPPVDDREYTGADIRNVCRTAWRTSKTVRTVAAGYVPSSRAASDTIRALRSRAQKNYISASYPGAYRLPADEPDPATDGRKGRSFNLDQ